MLFIIIEELHSGTRWNARQIQALHVGSRQVAFRAHGRDKLLP